MTFYRAYPSLNLSINVKQDKHAVQVVLPGLRFDDIDHTGNFISTIILIVTYKKKNNIWKVLVLLLISFLIHTFGQKKGNHTKLV